jgi:hypothetical protein
MTPPQRILLACIDTANILHPHLFHNSRKFTVYFAVAFHLLPSLAASTIAFRFQKERKAAAQPSSLVYRRQSARSLG